MSRLTELRTVMVVDDDAHVVYALRILLESQGFQVRTAPSGGLALEGIAAERPDVVVLDLAMPGTDGLEVCRRLRDWSQVPILVLSARTDEMEKVRALEAGADDYITKPFGSRELVARIRAALRREHSRRAEASTIRVGELDVDFLGRRVTRSGREIHLTPTEFALLQILASNVDRVLTHRFLLGAALGAGYEDAGETLRTYIKQLRRKLEPEPSRPQLIVSVPGVGYRFRAPSET